MNPPIQSLHTFPYGAVLQGHGVQFAVYSRSATEMRLLLYDRVEDLEPSQVIEFDKANGKCGDIWTLFVPFIGTGQLYHFQADGPWAPSEGHRFDGKARLIDPYAKALAGDFLHSRDGIVRPPKCVVVDDDFNWDGDRHLGRPLSESIIYEMHVRGFTQSGTSGVEHPGTYLGIIEKIPYLKSLGITAVELMPVHEFPTNHWHPDDKRLPNYWGYDTLAFFSPHRGYAADDEPGCQVREFKQMVKALHQAGIEVILDVVFNHTAEGNAKGPTLGFKGLENSVYYHLEKIDRSIYSNYSGCGNAINGNHPVVREMIFNCLRHWVCNYHIDGFRFDLASILSRDRHGRLVPNPPLVETISEDPLLADTKIIAEAWDAAGAYQVGSFSHMRWAEWNGRFRDDVRRYWNGFTPTLGEVATRMAGSSDLYQSGDRAPYHSINFVTAHDGFTMNDLVSYNEKHNEANGEDNRDGENHNCSMNFGHEGPTKNKEIEKLRNRQVKNFLATLFLSQGVPMLLSGDEVRRTQMGNNNTYCQDNALSWFNWEMVNRHKDMLRFTRGVIKLRRAQPTLRRAEFLSGEVTDPLRLPDVSWYNRLGHPVDWAHDQQTLTCIFGGNLASDLVEAGNNILIVMHSGWEPIRVQLPEAIEPGKWRLAIDTAAESPNDVYLDEDGPRLASTNITLYGRSLRCYVGY